MKNIFLLIALVCFFNSKAQTIVNSSIDNGGASVTATNASIIYTIGEVNVQETTNANIQISEGFINTSIAEALGLENLNLATIHLEIYPNPTSNILNIKSDLNFETYYLFDSNGKKLKENKLINKQISIQNLAKGSYFLGLKINGKIATKKIIKK